MLLCTGAIPGMVIFLDRLRWVVASGCSSTGPESAIVRKPSIATGAPPGNSARSVSLPPSRSTERRSVAMWRSACCSLLAIYSRLTSSFLASLDRVSLCAFRSPSIVVSAAGISALRRAISRCSSSGSSAITSSSVLISSAFFGFARFERLQVLCQSLVGSLNQLFVEAFSAIPDLSPATSTIALRRGSKAKANRQTSSAASSRSSFMLTYRKPLRVSMWGRAASGP